MRPQVADELGMNGNEPRVLVISGDPFGRTKSSSITMSSIFSCWPKDKLALIYVEGVPDETVCNQNFKIGAWSWDGLAHLVRLLPRGALRESREVPGTSSAPARKGAALLGKALRTLRLMNEYFPPVMPRTLDSFVRDFRPDVIYSTLGPLKHILFVTRIAEKYSLPIIPHFFDDWPNHFYADGFLWGYPQRWLQGSLRKLLARAPIGLCIGQEMAEAYHDRYSMPFEAMMKTIPDDCFDLPDAGEQKANIVLTYIGGLHLNRWKALMQIADSLSPNCEMRLFAPPADIEIYKNNLTAYPRVLLGSLPAEEVFSEMRRADILIHVESFDANTMAYAHFSVSTKIPQYMAARKAILAYGPESLASIRLIHRANAGLIISHSDSGDLQRSVAALAANTGLRQSLAESGFAYAQQHYSSSVTGVLLRKVMGYAITNRRQ